VTSASDIDAQQRAAKERYLAADEFRQKRARGAGIKLAIVGSLLNGANVFTVATRGRYFVFTTLLGPTMMLLGVWLAAFGQPFDASTGRPAKWGVVGSVSAIALGIALSVVALFLLNPG
jgi:hypothetical protein